MRVYEDIDKEKRKRKPVALWMRGLMIGLCIIAAAAFFVAEEHSRTPVDDMASELVLVPGGTFKIGTTPEILNEVLGACNQFQDWGCYPEVLGYSTPEVEVRVATFYIEKTEVTYGQYV